MKSAVIVAQLFAAASAFPHRLRLQKRHNPHKLQSIHGTVEATSSNWWYPNIDHTTGAVRDYAPGLATSNYPVYFAVSGGNATAFTNALYADGPNGGDRDNGFLAAEPRTIYVGPGTYVLDSTVYLDTDTVIIGDAIDRPVFQPSSNFDGTQFFVGGQGGDTNSGGESHFSVMMKNVILDTTPLASTSSFHALSWRVAQNSALMNVNITMPNNAHTGIWMGQGSTIQVGDVGFKNGNIGFHYAGMQQATLKNLYFDSCTTGIQVDNGFTVNVIGPTFNTVGSSIVQNSGSQWLSVVDAVSINSGDFFTSNEDGANFMLENIKKDTSDSAMVIVNGTTLLGNNVQSVGTYVYGNTYGANPVYQTSPTNQPLARSTVLAPGGGSYPLTVAPQYPDATIDDVINLKDSTQNGGFTLTGDGSTIDGPALQGALNTAQQANKIGYLPFGVYLVNETLTIPTGTKLVGNGWSTISGTGAVFSSESSPFPVVQVGSSGDIGSVDIQDVRFTVDEELPGAIILQVNTAGTNPGDVAIHNSLITVGGTLDTKISCSSESNCRGAYLGLYLPEGSSAYIDNLWSWVADHPTDGSSAGIRVAAKGGVLVESTQGTWLSGLGSEHWWLYNLDYHNAENVLVTLFQSETNYHQGSGADVAPPAPFTPIAADPDFSWCDGSDVNCPMTVAQYFSGGSDIYVYAAGSWNFDGGSQTNMNAIQQQANPLLLYGLTDHDATYVMRLPDGTQFGNGDSDGFGGSWGSLVAKYSNTS